MKKVNSVTIVRPKNRLLKFIKSEVSSGIFLVICCFFAIVMANSPWGHGYHEFWEMEISWGFGDSVFSKSLHFIINDVLMSIFFFLIGLEIKREVLVGELKSIKKSMLPILGGLGGMLTPMCIYFLLNRHPETAHGWAIPMATDIAFSLGILYLLGKRVPLSLKIFLTALAIIDDLGAILVIAIFYSNDLHLQSLLWSFVLLAFLYTLSRYGAYQPLLYLVIGIIIWLLFYKSGIHPTIAGVLLALAIPSQKTLTLSEFVSKTKNFLQMHKKDVDPDEKKVISELKSLTREIEPPLYALERNLHVWVFFLIVPLFVLANSGISVIPGESASLTQSFDYQNVSYQIGISLLLGKIIGISLFSYAGIKLGWCSMPTKSNFKQIFALSILGAIGFTMSLFITNLSFKEKALIDFAKEGILVASFVAALTGYFILKAVCPLKPTQK